MTAEDFNWNASETEPIEPFGVSQTALDECKLRLQPGEDFMTTDVWSIEDPSFWDVFAPELIIELDVEDLRDATGLELDDATLSVVIRDRELNKFLKVEEWPVLAIPDTTVILSSHARKFSHSERLDICVHVSPASSEERGAGIVENRGEVVARKVFRIRAITQKSKFPHRWMKPEDFLALGVAGDTIWLVHWLGEDLDRPPVETLEIWLNEAHREKFKILPMGGDAARLFQHEMAAAIFAEVALAVLSSDQEEPTEPTGTLQIISEELSNVSDLTLAEMRLKLQSHGGCGHVRAWAQSKFAVNELFSDLKFVGGKT